MTLLILGSHREGTPILPLYAVNLHCRSGRPPCRQNKRKRKGKSRTRRWVSIASHEFVIENIIFRISTTRLIISSPISSATRLPNLFIRIETILNLLPQLRVKPSQVSIQVSDHPFHFWHFLSCLSLNCISPQYSFSPIEYRRFSVLLHATKRCQKGGKAKRTRNQSGDVQK